MIDRRPDLEVIDVSQNGVRSCIRICISFYVIIIVILVGILITRAALCGFPLGFSYICNFKQISFLSFLKIVIILYYT